MNSNKERYDVKSISIKIEDCYPLSVPKKNDYIIPQNQIIKETANHLFFKHPKLGELIKYKLDNRIEDLDGYLTELNSSLNESETDKYDEVQAEDALKEFFNIRSETENITDRYLPKEFIIKYVNDITHNHILIAPTNTGKTSTLIEYLKSQNIKFIYLVPLRFLAKQVAIKYDIKLYLGGIKDKKSAAVNREVAQATIKNCLPLITTYDSFIGTIHDLIRDKFNWVLVIDEYHKLISDSGFRNTQLVKLNKLKRNYKKFIGLTGTPYGAIDTDNLRKENVKVIDFVFNAFKQKVQNYNLIYADAVITTEKHLKLFASYVIRNIRKGISIIYINNKLHLNNLFELIFVKDIKNLTMKKYTADTKEDPELEKAVELENFNINEGEKLLIFTTSVLSTGINFINQNFSDLYVFHENNLIELIQLINRFRKGIERVHDFVIKNIKTEVINYYTTLSQRLTMFYRINEEINQMLEYNILERSFVSRSEFGNNKSMLDDSSLLFVDNESIVNSLYIYYRVLNEFHKQIYNRPTLRKEYLEKYRFENIEIINLEELNLNQIAEDENFRNNLLNKFIDNKDYFIENYKTSLDNIDYNNEPLLSYLKHQKMVDIIESYKLYTEKYNFVDDFAIKLMNNDKYYKNIYRSLEYLWYLKNGSINENSKTILKENRIAVLKIDEVIHSFGSQIIDWNKVKFLLSELPENKFTEYFLGGPRLRYSLIYKLRNKDKYFDCLKNGLLFFKGLKIKARQKELNSYNIILNG